MLAACSWVLKSTTSLVQLTGLLPPSGHHWLSLLGPWETTWRQAQGYAGPASLEEGVGAGVEDLPGAEPSVSTTAGAQGATRDFGRWQESTTLHYR